MPSRRWCLFIYFISFCAPVVLLQIHLLLIRTVVNKLTFFWWQNFSVKALFFILEAGVVYRRETMQDYGGFSGRNKKAFLNTGSFLDSSI